MRTSSFKSFGQTLPLRKIQEYIQGPIAMQASTTTNECWEWNSRHFAKRDHSLPRFLPVCVFCIGFALPRIDIKVQFAKLGYVFVTSQFPFFPTLVPNPRFAKRRNRMIGIPAIGVISKQPRQQLFGACERLLFSLVAFPDEADQPPAARQHVMQKAERVQAFPPQAGSCSVHGPTC